MVDNLSKNGTQVPRSSSVLLGGIAYSPVDRVVARGYEEEMSLIDSGLDVGPRTHALQSFITNVCFFFK